MIDLEAIAEAWGGAQVTVRWEPVPALWSVVVTRRYGAQSVVVLSIACGTLGEVVAMALEKAPRVATLEVKQ